MQMKYKTITPEMAEQMLKTNENNRPISWKTVEAYARDMQNGKWTESNSAAISFSTEGRLQDGQHRLNAIILAGKPVAMWVCTDCDVNAVYDYNRRRSNRDYLNMSRQDLPVIMRSNTFIAMVRALINGCGNKLTSGDIEDYIDANYKTLAAYCDLGVFGYNKAKITITLIYVSTYMAFANGVDGTYIKEFFDILRSGMAERPEHYPIIAYRNYLLAIARTAGVTNDEIKRCQGSLKKFITGSCMKRVYDPKEIIWDIRKNTKQ